MNKSLLKAAMVLLLVSVADRRSGAQTYTVLYNFNPSAGDGFDPSGTLALDKAGNLYGTTQSGGTWGGGVVFELTPNSNETVLYNFNLPPDATLPIYGIVRSASGTLYGSANGGRFGTQEGDGAVFKVTAGGTETILHSFGSGADGLTPSGSLIEDSKGNLYGVTVSGGTHGGGSLFKISPSAKETILYNFSNTSAPEGSLLLDAQGNLYGTSVEGGKYSYGAAYEFSSSGKFHVIYSFCAQVHCTDGSQPQVGLARDSAGDLYGTTQNGGTYGQGTVFKLTDQGTETVLHSFGLANGDGYFPEAPVVLDEAGNLYGTTNVGGAHGRGIIFKIDSAGNETVLYSFCAESNCTDGSQPSMGSLIRDSAGNLYGVAGGGLYQGGVVFKLAP